MRLLNAIAVLVGCVALAGCGLGEGFLSGLGSGVAEGWESTGQYGSRRVRVASDASGPEIALVRVVLLDRVTGYVVEERDVSLRPGDEAVLEDLSPGEYEAIGVYADGYQDGGLPLTVTAGTDPESAAEADEADPAEPVWFVHP